MQIAERGLDRATLRGALPAGRTRRGNVPRRRVPRPDRHRGGRGHRRDRHQRRDVGRGDALGSRAIARHHQSCLVWPARPRDRAGRQGPQLADDHRRDAALGVARQVSDRDRPRRRDQARDKKEVGPSPRAGARAREGRTMSEPRFLIDPYKDWVAKEGIPIHEGFGLDLLDLDVASWPRLGAKGAFAHLTGRGDFIDMQIVEIPPGGKTAPQRHLYEEVVYVLAGRGSTSVESSSGVRLSFGWRTRSLFTTPLWACSTDL